MSGSPWVVVADPLPRLRPYDHLASRVHEAGGRLALAASTQPSDLATQHPDTEVLIVHGLTVDGPLLDTLPRCRTVVRYGIGYDDVDVAAATERGIHVCNAPSYCVDEVADHALMLLLALARRLPELTRHVSEGRWRGPELPDPHHLARLSGRTLGIVGFGRIGQAVASRAAAFGMRLVVSDPILDSEAAAAAGVALRSIDDLLATSDAVTLHVPLMPSTRHLIDAARLDRMKSTAWLLNLSRGPVVDEEALLAALRTGRIAGAGLDVLEVEPPDADHPLLHLDNVVVTPHFGAASAEATRDLHREVADSAVATLAGDRPPHAVNRPTSPIRSGA